MYQSVSECLNPDLIVDIGANYGFTALVFRHHFPQAKLILVEPAPNIHSYIAANLNANKIENVEVIKAFCGATSYEEVPFALNPLGSQDKRVFGDKSWKKLKVVSVSLNHIFRNADGFKSVFIKMEHRASSSRFFLVAWISLNHIPVG